jgi:hypothetical protein
MLGVVLSTVGAWVGIVGGVIGAVLGVASFVISRRDRKADQKRLANQPQTVPFDDLMRALAKFADRSVAVPVEGGGPMPVSYAVGFIVRVPVWLWILAGSGLVLVVSLALS